MKQLAYFLLVLAMATGIQRLAAQENEEWKSFPYTLGAGIETNMNAKEGWAMGFSAVFDRHIVNHLAAGLRGSMSNNQTGITNTEGSLFIRAYPIKVGLGGAFVQVGGGVTFFQEEELRKPAMFLDYSAGYRFFFLGGFYAEAYVRTGYPFQWAIGALAGHRFNF